ncbi:MAG: type IV pilus secretin PilQ [Nitrospirae bacterium]|nr:type IV pilus secretin PilQ [Nitrospirota bacterium]
MKMCKGKGLILSVGLVCIMMAYGCRTTGEVNGVGRPEGVLQDSGAQRSGGGADVKGANPLKSIEIDDYTVRITAEKPFEYSIAPPSDPFKIVARLKAVEPGAYRDRIVSVKEGIGEVSLQPSGTDGALDVEITLTSPFETTHKLSNNVLTIAAHKDAGESKTADAASTPIIVPTGASTAGKDMVEIKPEEGIKSTERPAERSMESHTAPVEEITLQEARSITGVSFKRERDAVSVIIHGDGALKPVISNVTDVNISDKIAIDIPNVKIAAELPREIAVPLKALRWEEGKVGVRIVLELQKETPYDVLTVNDTIIVSLTTFDRIDAAVKRAVKGGDSTPTLLPARPDVRADISGKKKDYGVADAPVANMSRPPTVGSGTVNNKGDLKAMASKGEPKGEPKGEIVAPQLEDRAIKVIKGEGAESQEVKMCGGQRLECGTQNKIRLNIQNAPVTALLKLLAEESGCDIVVDPDVSGVITMQVKDAPWYQVVELIQKILKLGCDVTGNIIRIAQQKTLDDTRNVEIASKKREDEERKRMAESKQQEEKEMVELARVKRMECILKYIPADDIQKRIQGSQEQIVAGKTGGETIQKQAEQEFLTRFLTYRGMSYADEAENRLTVIDIESALRKVENFVRALDVPKKQVLIEAKIIEVNNNMSDSLGINWGFFTKSIDGTGAIGVGQGTGVTGQSFLADMPSTVSNLGRGIALGFINAQRTLGLDLKLQALETSNNGRIITSPRLLTMDREQAKITQGQEIPYPVMNPQGVVSAAFKSVAVNITITPKITPGRLINLAVDITKEDLVGYTTIGGSQTPNTTKLTETTKVIVKDGETLVLGGIFKQNTAITDEGTAGLKDIPILGWLFKTASKSNTESEYLIFITPRVVERDLGREITECKVMEK